MEPIAHKIDQTVLERVMQSVHVDEQDRWIWLKGTVNDRYPATKIGGKRVLVYRWLYALTHPEFEYSDHTLDIDHLARPGQGWEAHTLDVNPDHMEAVSSAENARRKFGNFTGKSVGPPGGLTRYNPEKREGYLARQRVYDRARYAKAREARQMLLKELI